MPAAPGKATGPRNNPGQRAEANHRAAGSSDWAAAVAYAPSSGRRSSDAPAVTLPGSRRAMLQPAGAKKTPQR